jgi:hypothetical protein
VRKQFSLDSGTETQRYKGKECLSWESEVLGIEIWWIEMEMTASTNIFSTFCHRMAYNFAQDPFFNTCQREKCVWLGVTFMGRRAGKMRKVRAQALLSLSVWSEWMLRSNSPELWSGDLKNWDDLQPSRNVLRAIFLCWANLKVAILSVAWGWCCNTVPRVKVLQEEPYELCFWFAHLVHEQVQKGLKRSKTDLTVGGHYVPLY